MAAQTTAVIVNWNGARFLQPLLESLYKESPAAIIVVDNNSTDGSREILSAATGIHAILNPINAGFAAAANQGIAKAQTTYVLILNVDVEALPGSLAVMERFLNDNPDVAIVGPQLLSASGEVQRTCRSFPTILKLCFYLSYLDRLIPTGYVMSKEQHTKLTDVDQPMGAALFLRRAAVEQNGAFDPEFPLYMEEVDLCERLKKNGWRIVYHPESRMIHYGGGSTDQDWEKSQKKFFEGVIRYFRKRSSERKVHWLKLFLFPSLILRSMVLLLGGRISRSIFYLRMSLDIFDL